jgi:hypothetical protein
VKAKQQFIIEKLSKNTPIKENQKQSTPQRQQQQQLKQQQSPLRQSTSYHHHEQQVSKEDVQPSNVNITNNNNNNTNSEEEGVKFGGESADETSSFVSASVRERAAAMSGFLTKKHDGPTNGQARAMEWRVDGSGGSGGGGGTQREVTPKKIAPNFVSKFDKVTFVVEVEENEVNGGGGTTTPMSYKKKSRPSFLSQFDDSPRANNKLLDEAASPRRPLTPRTSLAPSQPSPRTSSLLPSPRCTSPMSSSFKLTTTPRSRTPKSNGLLLSPRTPRTQQSPRNSSRVLPSPRMSSHNKASSLSGTVLNCSTAAEAGNITQEIDDWFGGMSLSASISAEEGGGEEKQKKEEHNDNDHHDVDGNDGISLSSSEGSTDLDNLISEANGFLECVVSEEENVDTIVYFGFHENNNGGDDKDDDVASAGVNSDDIESELVDSALQLAQGFTKFLTHDSDDLDENERQDEETFVRELALSAAGEGEEEEAEEQQEKGEGEVEDEEADWEGWNQNNDFFANFDEEQEEEEEEVVSQTDEPEEVEPQQEEYTSHRSVEADLPKSETKCIKPKLRVHIKGAPQVSPKKEEKESMFFAASQPSPVARDDEQLLDTNDVESMVMPSPVSVESKSPKKFGLRISERGGASQESEEKSVEEATSQEDEFASFTQWNKPRETEKNVHNTPPKLTVYIKGAPQFTPSRHVQEDAFYMSQPSPVFGDDKRLLSSSSFAASPSMAEQKNEKTSTTSTTKKHFKNFVGKSLPVPKYQATANNKKGNSLNSPSVAGLIGEQEEMKFDQGSALNTDKSGNQGLDNENFFFAAPTSPVRQAKDAMREGCSTKKKIFGLLSGKKKKSKGLYLLDD